MSRTRPSTGERIMLDYPCQHCGATPGEWCYRDNWPPTSMWAADLHAARFYAATQSGRLPLSDNDVTPGAHS